MEVIEATVPAKFKVLAPRLNLPDVKVNAPLTVGDPLKLKPPALLNSTLPSVAPEMVLALPFIKILPAPLCVAVPTMLPPTVNVFPLSARVPAVSVRLPVNVLLLEASIVTVLPLLSMIKLAGPLDAGHSIALVVRVPTFLYCNVLLAPKVGAVVIPTALPSIESVPLILNAARVLLPLPDKVKLV